MVHGGASFAAALAAQGLIDEYCVVIQPVAIGGGQALFGTLPRRCASTSSRPGASTAASSCTSTGREQAPRPRSPHGEMTTVRSERAGAVSGPRGCAVSASDSLVT